MISLIKKGVLLLIVLCIGGGALAGWFSDSDKEVSLLRTVKARRGDLVATISATGTVEPEEVINVGAQVAGKINSFGNDKKGKTIDYGSIVEEGTVLARIDDSLYSADVALAQAQVQQAEAGLLRSEADLVQSKSKLYQDERDWERARELGPSSKALAGTSYDSYKSKYEIAQAGVAVSEAMIAQARGAVAQAKAALQRANRNLGYCTIKSPVKGVIIDRRVNIGQTVVSSLNAPSLFLLAKDLKRMQVWVAVNEADIGNIHPGQPVSFTVDAYPGEIFRGEVGKVRLNATMTQNVVNYTVEVITDNSDGRLLPYLTANVQFELNRRNDILIVPNTALRWFPRSGEAGQEYNKMMEESGAAGESGKANEQPANPASKAVRGKRQGLVWIKDGNHVRPVNVHTGMSDGSMTEVLTGDLKEGMAVVIGEETSKAQDTATNPFVPQIGRGGRPGSRD